MGCECSKESIGSTNIELNLQSQNKSEAGKFFEIVTKYYDLANY